MGTITRVICLMCIGHRKEVRKLTSERRANARNVSFRISLRWQIHINTHFLQIGPSLASQIQDLSSKYTDYMTPTKQIFSLAETSSQEIFELIQKIPGNKASGLDNISARLLKEAAPVVTPSLTYIINLSITTGIFSKFLEKSLSYSNI